MWLSPACGLCARVLAAPVSPRSVALGDVNGDGRLDVVAMTAKAVVYYSADVSVSPAVFGAPVTIVNLRCTCRSLNAFITVPSPHHTPPVVIRAPSTARGPWHLLVFGFFVLVCLFPCVLASLRPCVLASLRPCVLASLRPCVPASLRPCVLASLRPCTLLYL
jgi:hypothetical protein